MRWQQLVPGLAARLGMYSRKEKEAACRGVMERAREHSAGRPEAVVEARKSIQERARERRREEYMKDRDKIRLR